MDKRCRLLYVIALLIVGINFLSGCTSYKTLVLLKDPYFFGVAVEGRSGKKREVIQPTRSDQSIKIDAELDYGIYGIPSFIYLEKYKDSVKATTPSSKVFLFDTTKDGYREFKEDPEIIIEEYPNDLYIRGNDIRIHAEYSHSARYTIAEIQHFRSYIIFPKENINEIKKISETKSIALLFAPFALSSLILSLMYSSSGDWIYGGAALLSLGGVGIALYDNFYPFIKKEEKVYELK